MSERASETKTRATLIRRKEDGAAFIATCSPTMTRAAALATP